MAMTRKTITLTPQMDVFVKAQIESGRYGNDSEYFRDLVRRDQERIGAAQSEQRPRRDRTRQGDGAPNVGRDGL